MEDKLLTASELTTEEQLQICQKSRDEYSELCRTMEISNEKLVDELREALQAEKDKNASIEVECEDLNGNLDDRNDEISCLKQENKKLEEQAKFFNGISTRENPMGDIIMSVYGKDVATVSSAKDGEFYPYVEATAPQDNEMKEVE